MIIMTRSRNGSPVRRGGSPVHRGGSPVRRGASPVRRGGGDDDRSPSPSITLRKSRGKMQTPSAATKSQLAAKSDSPPRGRTMTRSASRAASRGGSPKSAADNVKIVVLLLLLTISHLTPTIPTVSGPRQQVFLVVDTALRPLISLRRVWFVPVPRETKVSNATMAVATLGSASGSAAGRQVSIRLLEVVSRGGEVLCEVVQAVVKAVG